MTAVGVTGGTGAMGTAVRDVASARSDIDISLIITRNSDSVPQSGVDVIAPDDVNGALDEVDVIVDFSVPDATVDLLGQIEDDDVAVVCGTTGFDEDQRETLRSHGETMPILYAPNFSRGVYVLQKALETTVARLPGFDIELLETHHNRKRDAPSGTAYRLLETIQESRPESPIVHGRSGEAPRSSEEIGVHALRAGSITGEHEVLLAGPHEEVRLTHRAESRDVFAAGALDAAAWIDGKPPGWYGFADVVEV